MKTILDKIEELKEDIAYIQKTERIVCSAVWFQVDEHHMHQPSGRWGGLTICGMRHHNCYYTASLIGEHLKDVNNEEGFITSKNRFVDRSEAASIAFVAGQTMKYHRKLHSEDLWTQEPIENT